MYLTKRQDVFYDPNTHHKIIVCDKACQTTEIVKWSLLLSLFGLFFLWLTIGYWHARRRMRQGQQPMRYHRWLAPKVRVPQNSYAYYNNHQQPGYGMQNYQEPPPVYSQDGMPPVYQPPPGASKVNPQQMGFAPQQSGVVGAQHS